MFFENNSGVLSFNIANNGTITESVTQANWNIDKLDSTGDDSIILDIDRFKDINALGVGCLINILRYGSIGQ